MLYDPKWESKTTLDEPWRETLLRAADVIREHGLAKFTQHDWKTGGVCLHGALSFALTGRPWANPQLPAYCAAESAVHRHMLAVGAVAVIRSGRDSATWNNDESRTAEDVIAILEGAAAAH